MWNVEKRELRLFNFHTKNIRLLHESTTSYKRQQTHVLYIFMSLSAKQKEKRNYAFAYLCSIDLASNTTFYWKLELNSDLRDKCDFSQRHSKLPLIRKCLNLRLDNVTSSHRLYSAAIASARTAAPCCGCWKLLPFQFWKKIVSLNCWR